MPTTTSYTTQVAVRLDHKMVARLDNIAKRMSRPGLTISRSDVVRLAIVAGMPIVARERRKKPR